MMPGIGPRNDAGKKRTLITAFIGGGAVMAYLVVAASILAFLAFIWLIDHEPASRVSSYAYVNPLIAVVLSAAVGGERLAPVQLAGAACVLSGVVITLRSRRA